MEETIELDLREIAGALLRRAWLIVLCAVIVGAAVFAYTFYFVTPEYRARINVYVNNKSSTNQTSALSSGELAVAQRLVLTYVNIIKSDTVVELVAQEVANQTGTLYSGAAIRNMLSTQSDGETEMFDVYIDHPDPQMAATIANAFAAVAPEQIAQIIEGSSAKIIDMAKVPTSPYSPNYTRNALLGACVGVLIAVVIIIAQMLLDIHVRTEEDLARISTAPVLGTIPDFNAESKSKYRYETDPQQKARK